MGAVWQITAHLRYMRPQGPPPRPGEPFGSCGGRVYEAGTFPVQSSYAGVNIVPFPTQSFGRGVELKVEWHVASAASDDSALDILSVILEEVSSCECEAYDLNIAKEVQ